MPDSADSLPAPIVSAAPSRLEYGDGATLDCVYVHVDGKGRSDVVSFLHGWRPCCDLISVEWRSVRRTGSALVSLELRQCSADGERGLRLVFDAARDAPVLEHLMASEALVVGSRPYGSFANVMVAYGVDAEVVQAASAAARHGLRQLQARAS